MARHIGQLPNPLVLGYIAVDPRPGWNPRRDLELSVAAQNLLYCDGNDASGHNDAA